MEASCLLTLERRHPDFTLMNQDREAVTLSKLARASRSCWRSSRRRSAACAPRSCARSATRWPSWARRNAQVFGISVDTFFTLKAFQDQQKLTLSAAERLQQGRDPRLRRVQRGHDRAEGHRQAGGVRHRQGRRRPPPRRCSTTRATSRITKTCTPRSPLCRNRPHGPRSGEPGTARRTTCAGRRSTCRWPRSPRPRPARSCG